LYLFLFFLGSLGFFLGQPRVLTRFARTLFGLTVKVVGASLGGKPGAAARSNYSPADVFSIGETNFSLLRLFMNWVRH